jgi:hypothetical protein
MWRSFSSPFGADAHRRSQKHVEDNNSREYIENPGRSLVKGSHRRHRQARLEKANRPNARSMEMKVWAVLFGLVLLATIILIILVLTEGPAHASALAKSHLLAAMFKWSSNAF